MADWEVKYIVHLTLLLNEQRWMGPALIRIKNEFVTFELMLMVGIFEAVLDS